MLRRTTCYSCFLKIKNYPYGIYFVHILFKNCTSFNQIISQSRYFLIDKISFIVNTLYSNILILIIKNLPSKSTKKRSLYYKNRRKSIIYNLCMTFIILSYIQSYSLEHNRRKRQNLY